MGSSVWPDLARFQSARNSSRWSPARLYSRRRTRITPLDSIPLRIASSIAPCLPPCYRRRGLRRASAQR